MSMSVWRLPSTVRMIHKSAKTPMVPTSVFVEKACTCTGLTTRVKVKAIVVNSAQGKLILLSNSVDEIGIPCMLLSKLSPIIGIFCI